MSEDRLTSAAHAGIATGFFLFGGSIVLGALVGDGPAGLFLAVVGPLTALLAGVYAFRSALYGGGR